MGSSPQGSNCQWVTVGTFRKGQWGRGCHMDSEVRVNPGLPSRVLQFMQPQSGGDLGAQGTYGGLCPVDLQSPHCGPYWLGPGLEEAVTLSLPLLPPGSTVCLECHLQDLLPHPPPHGWPEEPEGQLGLAPGSLSDDGWERSEDPALRALAAELWLCQDWTLEGKSCLRTCPFLSEQRLTEIFTGTVTWPWPDPQNKGSDTKMFKQLTTLLPQISRKGLHWELSGSLGFLRHEPLLSLQGPQYIFLGSTPWPSVLV